MVQISASNLLTHRIAAVFNVQNSRKTPQLRRGDIWYLLLPHKVHPIHPRRTSPAFPYWACDREGERTATIRRPSVPKYVAAAVEGQIGRCRVAAWLILISLPTDRYKLAPNRDGAGALRAEVRLDTDVYVRPPRHAAKWLTLLELILATPRVFLALSSPPHLLLHSSTLNAPPSALTSSTYSTLANGFTSSIYSTPTNGIQTQARPQEAQTGTKPLKAGIEGIVNGVIELEEMVLTMRGNKGDLVKLKKHLDALDAVDCSNVEGDLKQRVETLKKELHPIITDHNRLVKRTKMMGFVNSKEDKEVIQNIQNSIISCIQDFTFHCAISIEKLVADLTPQVQEIQKNVDTMTPQVQEIQRNVDTMTPQVQEIQRNVDSMAPQVDQVQQKAILADLKYIPAQYNAANTPDTCMKGTRVGILKDVLTHLTLTSFSEQIVMLSGSAGSGKSTIAKTVAQILAEENHILAASFFFSRHHAERRELNFLPTTLALQLADYSSGFRNCLVNLLHKDHARILFSDPKEQFQKLVID
ncbi:hypothetical protein B0H16DRAFT_1694333, partial [Mycena metata]